MRRPHTPKRDIAAEVTAIIIDRLEKGMPPWKRPWHTHGTGGPPLRYQGKPYSGVNRLLLWAIGDSMGYRSRYWMTYAQAEALGGQVRRGQKASPSIYFNSVSRQVENTTTGATEQRMIRFMRFYTVFSADQIDGLPAHYYPPTVPDAPPEPSARQAAIDAFFAAVPSDVRRGGSRAYFSPGGDYIQLPLPSAFRSADHEATTSAHEHVHWTGHEARLARAFGKRFGDKAYAFEELVAEIGAGMVCADLGLPNELHDSHASYVHHWLTILRGDKTAIITAAARAEAAYRYLAGFSTPTEVDAIADELTVVTHEPAAVTLARAA